MAKGIMIAAVKSGSGKTMFTCGLLRLLKEKNLKVRSFKCGPDYIDPMFHRRVLGIAGGNLDSFFCDGKMLEKVYEEGSWGYDIVVTEGVMGIYDGAGTDRSGSSYDVAEKLGLSIILLADCSGMGKTLVSVIGGIVADDTGGLIKGIVLNNISGHYYKLIKPLIEEKTGTLVMGYLPKIKDGGFESRHLGLKMPEEVEDISRRIDLIAEQISKTVDVDALLGEAKAGCKKTRKIAASLPPRVKIAIARDEAFCFYYEENLALLESLGAGIVFFSPIYDDKIPEDADGIYMGGGYPELHTEKLSANTSMLLSVKNAIEDGMPSFAECGGFMYLQDEIDGKKMVGVIHSKSQKTSKLVRFGYVSAQTDRETFLPKGETVRGHEFHYYDSEDNGSDIILTKASDGKGYKAVMADENHWWGYPHLYLPSNVNFAERFLMSCEKYSNKRKGRV